MLTSDEIQVFLIEADLAGRLLQDGAVARMHEVHGTLDYSRDSLLLLSKALRAMVEGRLAYAFNNAIINAAQYLGETILHAVGGEWAPRDEAIEFRVRCADNRLDWFDVYTPVLDVVRAAQQGDVLTAESRLHTAFDAAVSRSLRRDALP